MLVNKIIGNIANYNLLGKENESIILEWFELEKKLLRKCTNTGKDIVISLSPGEHLHDGDIIFDKGDVICFIKVNPTKSIVLTPQNNFEYLTIGYQVGNRHLPLYYEKNNILLVFDDSVLDLVKKSGIKYSIESRKLSNGLEPIGHHHHD